MNPKNPQPLVKRPNERKYRAILLWTAKAIVGLSILAWILFRVDLVEVFAQIKSAQSRQIAAAALCSFAAMIPYAFHHKSALAFSARPVPASTFLKILFQLRFYALALPGNAGALVKWHKITRVTGSSGTALVIMLATRYTHSVTVIGFAAFAVYLDPNFPWPAFRPLFAAIAVAVVFITWILALARVRDRSQSQDRTNAQNAGPHRMLWRQMQQAAITLGGWAPAQRIRYAASLIAFASAGLCFEILQDYFIARAIGIDTGLIVFIWLRGAIMMCHAAPFTVSGLGVREAGMVAILVNYGIGQEKALAFSFTYFIVAVLFRGAVGSVLEGWDVYIKKTPHHSN
ncbi:MAG: hypothetical protein AMXMBFR84_29690 [Candidatus Hydrogenedentota bacterium]